MKIGQEQLRKWFGLQANMEHSQILFSNNVSREMKWKVKFVLKVSRNKVWFNIPLGIL